MITPASITKIIFQQFMKNQKNPDITIGTKDPAIAIPPEIFTSVNYDEWPAYYKMIVARALTDAKYVRTSIDANGNVVVDLSNTPVPVLNPVEMLVTVDGTPAVTGEPFECGGWANCETGVLTNPITLYVPNAIKLTLPILNIGGTRNVLDDYTFPNPGLNNFSTVVRGFDNGDNTYTVIIFFTDVQPAAYAIVSKPYIEILNQIDTHWVYVSPQSPDNDSAMKTLNNNYRATFVDAGNSMSFGFSGTAAKPILNLVQKTLGGVVLSTTPVPALTWYVDLVIDATCQNITIQP